MGEMTIRNIDDALLLELRTMADRRGIPVEGLVSELLGSALRLRDGGRAAGALAILSAQPGIAKHDSVDLLRADRDR